MSALEAIKIYGGDSESSEDEFYGFDSNNKSEQYPEVSRTATLFLTRPNIEDGQAVGQIDDDKAIGDNSNSAKDSVTSESIDSEGSYFVEQRRKNRKRTKKEQRKAVVEKNVALLIHRNLYLVVAEKVVRTMFPRTTEPTFTVRFGN